MTTTNSRLQALVDSGRVKAVGGTSELDTIISHVREADEAIITLRKDGRPFGVLVYSSKGEDEDTVNRAVDAVELLNS